MPAKGQPAVEKMLCWGRFFRLCSASRNRRRTTHSKFWPSCRCASVLRFMEELLLRMARRPHVPLANFKLSPNASLGGWTMRAAADSAFDCTNRQLLSRLCISSLSSFVLLRRAIKCAMSYWQNQVACCTRLACSACMWFNFGTHHNYHHGDMVINLILKRLQWFCRMHEGISDFNKVPLWI